MSIKTDKLIEELSKGIKRTEKKNKKVLISFTEEEYKNIEKVAKKLNTNVSKFSLPICSKSKWSGIPFLFKDRKESNNLTSELTMLFNKKVILSWFSGDKSGICKLPRSEKSSEFLTVPIL